ncbi:MAG: hypothetical protein LBQ66_04105 [Planctomycetaceae bacterium]|nr:hypothetical protein [Planctomycetaceae bacterium]
MYKQPKKYHGKKTTTLPHNNTSPKHKVLTISSPKNRSRHSVDEFQSTQISQQNRLHSLSAFGNIDGLLYTNSFDYKSDVKFSDCTTPKFCKKQTGYNEYTKYT